MNYLLLNKQKAKELAEKQQAEQDKLNDQDKWWFPIDHDQEFIERETAKGGRNERNNRRVCTIRKAW